MQSDFVDDRCSSHEVYHLHRCERQFASYVCPRCNLRYCSLACYKDPKHLECSETFYRDNVQEEIKARGLSNSEIRQMASILNRVQGNAEAQEFGDDEEEENEEDDIQQLAEMLSELNANDDADYESLLAKLPASHREEFEKFIKAGQLPEYKPWWISHHSEKTNLVQPLDEQEEEQEQEKGEEQQMNDDQIWSSKRPDLPADLPNFSKISKATSSSSSSSSLNACLLNIIMTYCYVVRHLLGDLYEDPVNTCHIIEQVSRQVLFSTAAGFPFSDMPHAAAQTVDDVIGYEDGLKSSIGAAADGDRRNRLMQTLLQDALILLDDNLDYLERAMYDMWQTLETLSKRCPRTKRKSVMLAARKAYYYFAYAVHLMRRDEKKNVALMRVTIATECERIKISEQSFEHLRRTAKKAKQQLESTTSGGNKIQELQ